MKARHFVGLLAGAFLALTASVVSTAVQAATIRTQVDLSSSFNSFTFTELKNTGSATIAGVPFTTPGTNGNWSGIDPAFNLNNGNDGTAITIPINIASPVTSFFTMINSTGILAHGALVGTINFIDSFGKELSFELREGINIRNQLVDDVPSEVNGSLSDGFASFDSQRFDLSALANLKEIRLTVTSRLEDAPVLYAATADVIATPLPSSMPMFVSGLALAGIIVQRRSRRSTF